MSIRTILYYFSPDHFNIILQFLTLLQLLDLMYSGPLKVEHNPFQEAVRLSICSTFELNFPLRNNVNSISPKFTDYKTFYL